MALVDGTFVNAWVDSGIRRNEQIAVQVIRESKGPYRAEEFSPSDSCVSSVLNGLASVK